MPTVELLAPAGNPEALDAALAEGADAVYLGSRSFNARMRSSNFAFNQLEAAVEVCHKQSKKLYVAVNTVFEQREADRMWQYLQYLERVGPDGIIVQDLGVAKMARDHFPKLCLHASTQMNVASAKGVNLLSRLGFKRAVLARELSLDEVRAVRAGSNLELEVFVHGALCVSESGLCLFSSYLGGKSANRGACAQACRRLYSTESESGYWFSPDDLELIEYVPDLMEAGVESFKIEGRMKSAEYVGQVVAAYRHMIDNWKLDREKALAKAQAMLQSDFARRKTRFFFAGKLDAEYIRPDQAGGTGIALGAVRDFRVYDEKRFCLMDSYDGLAEGDSLRFHRPDDSGRFTAKVREVRKHSSGMLVRIDEDIDVRQSDIAYLVQSGSMARRYQQALPRDLARFRRFPSRDTAPAVDIPRPSKAELRAAESVLPDGLYALVGRTGDLHVLNSERPTRAMLLFNRANAEVMRAEEKTLPFKRDNLILWLDPFLPESDADWLSGELDYWIGRGQRIFVANNVGHLGMLRGRTVDVAAATGGAKVARAAARAASRAESRAGAAGDGDLGAGAAGAAASEPRAGAGGRAGGAKKAEPQPVTIIAGPYLYAFNQWAAAFLFGEGALALVPPLEISKQDFQKVSEAIHASELMPIVFSYPALFRIRADLASVYDFTTFSDRDGSAYELSSMGARASAGGGAAAGGVAGGEGSVVTPMKPFSIIDRLPFLKKEGLGKFILDFSSVALTKPLYRQVMRAAAEEKILPETGRFNWKEGFWNPEESAR
jgi:putative protease